ncbi:hypothetical protein AvCA_37160 [Azotobacter vinelandii CA]|uniref:Uncharacterized protein n=2 Tax=Azotobacter vinelandii TaxID=354 RepID=C1DRY7_AZOVD|nr:hypothetical protein Avin_37160 [Azotobacter vinelandii DJ]AGK16188.1 hypothetical protein AvCA_37160 [Azotobacter vinelandii CA]AGK21558.1 hypothetical protein AvCA6_37160 [Azotobacter vinelandii CA6]
MKGGAEELLLLGANHYEGEDHARPSTIEWRGRG